METKPVYVVSDIHLGAVPPATERAFRGFLDHAAVHASSLLINGDLFDFWFEYRHVILAEHYRVVAKLKDVVEAGVPVSFVGGNHDAWAGPFLRDEVGITLYDGPVEMDLGGRRTLVAHGDGVGRGDLKYRALKRMIRNPVTVGAFRALHPDWGRRIAGLASTTEHKADTGDQAARGRAAFIESWAMEQLRARPEIDLVLAGHAHVAQRTEVAPGRWYVNSGDWLRTFDYVVLPPGGGAPEPRAWPPAA
ncbi:UDP-2,3-diacylglucosamine diphosphatase [Longimicrobium terrae]|uniref:UDP-2,3-diacylglucosamine hydrolase n=1 Tax=Longimicrobium terrae TaxID=1639882 RepID=A0A841GX32_9BACT|nr:UDP-2,3-diacylglucosamine diphosphatase [Longimicrobium terrae]MBB4634901.1 UDP-2,3-diacylglucosamine hydrolase [Longimicrobium terrae]MBB6069296.1 UDP-2,3-diacylglucosamine hydrolase [Longimicrobium terrae]NNC31895.1 UDP-2,3-diacylglucosamine diphosphatase [Longimicrobium terrae]